MSCRTACRPTVDAEQDTALAEVYVELFRAGRREEFRWLARSRGLSGTRVDELWQELTRRLGRHD